jgi:hypothetical protein
MTMETIWAVAGALAFLIYVLLTLTGWVRMRPGAWLLPAALAVLFFLGSLAAVWKEGLLGFWTEHTRNLWGTQIWFDLLLAAALAWTLLAAPARKHRMALPAWLLLVLVSGSIGLLAMAARILYLGQHQALDGDSPVSGAEPGGTDVEGNAAPKGR